MAGYFAVFKDDVLVEFTPDTGKASLSFLAYEGEKMVRITSLKELASHFADAPTTDIEPTGLLDGISRSLDSALDKLQEMGFTEENVESTAQKIKDKGKNILAEVKSLGLKSATQFRDQLKEFTTAVDKAIVEVETETNSEDTDREDTDREDTDREDTDRPLPYGRN